MIVCMKMIACRAALYTSTIPSRIGYGAIAHHHLFGCLTNPLRPLLISGFLSKWAGMLQDEACTSVAMALLYHGGFHALQLQRVAHCMWESGNITSALRIQVAFIPCEPCGLDCGHQAAGCIDSEAMTLGCSHEQQETELCASY